MELFTIYFNYASLYNVLKWQHDVCLSGDCRSLSIEWETGQRHNCTVRWPVQTQKEPQNSLSNVAVAILTSGHQRPHVSSRLLGHIEADSHFQGPFHLGQIVRDGPQQSNKKSSVSTVLLSLILFKMNGENCLISSASLGQNHKVSSAGQFSSSSSSASSQCLSSVALWEISAMASHMMK